jgi:hypothetical protein
MEKLLSSVAAGGVNDSILNDVLALPTDDLRRMSDQLRGVLGGNSVKSRARVVLSLAGGWLPAAEAAQLAQKALHDDAPQVRTAAATVLRQLAQR